MGVKRDPYVGTETIHRAQGPICHGIAGSTGGENLAGNSGVGSGFTGMRRNGGAAGDSLSGTSGSSGGLSGMRRSHTTGQNLANLAHSNHGAGSAASFLRLAEKSKATTLTSISETIDERGSLASSGSLPRFTPGSLSAFSDADMRRIGMNRPKSRASSRSPSIALSDAAETNRVGREDEEEQDDERGTVSRGLEEEDADSVDSPLGF